MPIFYGVGDMSPMTPMVATPLVTATAQPAFLKETDHPRDTNVTEGQTVEIVCQAAAEPVASVVWLKNGMPLSRTLVQFLNDDLHPHKQ